MKQQKSSLTASAHAEKSNIESEELKKITEFILKKVPTEKLIYFGITITNIKNTNCFEYEDRPKLQELNNYYILLVPSSSESRSDITIQQRIEQDIKIIADVTIIVHRMEEINLALQNGSSFFTTIYKKGILLHDSQNEPFVSPAKGEEIDKRLIKREKFWNQWLELCENFLTGARFYAELQKNNMAIFMLHQTLQHCYSGMLRVLTGYRTNSNGLRRLLKLIENILPGFRFTLLKGSAQDARLTGLLLKGFSDARYNDDFKATNEEVSLLITRIQQVLQSANVACMNRINQIRQGNTPYVA